MLTVSIITPSLNQAQFIERALQSVQRQGEKSVEHIVIDGASQDETVAVLEEFSGNVRWISEPDNGCAAAMNKGLRMATGDVVGWLNADHVYDENALRCVQRVFQKHPQVDVMYGRIRYIDEDDETISLRRLRRVGRGGSAARRLWGSCFLNPPAVFFRRRMLDQAGLFDERWKYWAHYDFWLRLAQHGARFTSVSQVLGARRIHAGNRCVGPAPLSNYEQSAIEAIQMMAEKHGRAADRWLLNYGRIRAQRQGKSREDSTGYDRAVLRNALLADRRWNTSNDSQADQNGGKQAGGKAPRRLLIRLAIRHAIKEIEQIFRRPHYAARFAPVRPRRFIHNRLRRRIFKLRHHAPRPLQLPPEYSTTAPPAQAPRISIVTPNYNSGAYLERTLLSILDQNYPNLEYIIQDGGSTDQSVQIIQKYAGRLSSWESAPDRGQSHAINQGMRRASGEILAFLNSDDLLMPGSLAYVARYFDQHPEVDVVYSHRLLVDEHDRVIGRWVLPPHNSRVLLFADYVPQETMFWRRRAWESVGGRLDESFNFALDWDLILRFREQGLRFVRLPRFLGAFRVTEEQKTKTLIETVGRREMTRLRKRYLGRSPTNREIRRAIRPYMWRHWLWEQMYALGMAKY